MSVAAVVVAGGQGSRFGGLKQFVLLGGDSVAAHSVRHARSVASQVILVVPVEYQGSGEGADVVAIGGATRAESVRAGLAYCGDADIVVVHDAARPLATEGLFHAVVQAVLDGADGAVPALAITDTVKRVAEDHGAVVVRGTESRDELVTVQTPQAFRREVLVRAHGERADATDDAALVEALGARVVTVPGERGNLKITHPDDLSLAASAHGAGQ